MARAEEHIQALLELPVEDRAHAAKLLLDSLDDSDAEPGADEARAAEAVRRALALSDGSKQLVDADEVRRRIAARLRDVRSR